MSSGELYPVENSQSGGFRPRHGVSVLGAAVIAIFGAKAVGEKIFGGDPEISVPPLERTYEDATISTGHGDTLSGTGFVFSADQAREATSFDCGGYPGASNPWGDGKVIVVCDLPDGIDYPVQEP